MKTTARVIDTVLTATLVLCAAVSTGVLVKRYFTGGPGELERSPVFVKKWRALLGEGARTGRPDASTQLIVLSDFECPACKSFHTTLRTLQRRHPSDLAITHVHYPLEYHRFAEAAAQAADCAGAQGHFESMADVLFNQQQSLGLRTWMELAGEATVPNLPAFEACIRSVDSMEGVRRGKEIGDAMEIRGVPTIVVNGWKVPHVPTVEELERMVQAVLDGGSPV